MMVTSKNHNAVNLNMHSNISRSDTLRDIARHNSDSAPPSIAALFLIEFDIRKGYSVTWKQSILDVDLDNIVEYKSLPSGLHNVREDLMFGYFVHGDLAGQSAFINVPDDSEHRNARMLAVGVLVPLKRGRLGKAWMHAPALKDLVRQIAEEPNELQLLERYWKTHQLRQKETETPPESPLDVFFKDTHHRPHQQQQQQQLQQPQQQPPLFIYNLAASSSSDCSPSHRVLAPLHPALSLSEYLDHFGPLVFPLYRLALLRKRILIVGDAPVHSACNYVYDLSLLSTLPDSLLPLLPPSAITKLRPRPLFSVGVHDLSYLSALSRQYNYNRAPESQWIANTSDKILSSKTDLYDVIIDLPPEYAMNAPGGKTYPKMRIMPHSTAASTRQKSTNAGGTVVRATQRDARRYINLKKGLQRQYRATRVESHLSTTNDIREGGEGEEVSSDSEEVDSLLPSSFAEVVEPTSWSALAYSSFMWWASAGEKSGEYEYGQESEADARMLYTAINRLTQTVDMNGHKHGNGGVNNGDEEEDIDGDILLHNETETAAAAATDGSTGMRRRPGGYRRVIHRQPWEITLIAYFRSLTARIFTVLNDVVSKCDSEGGSGEEGEGAEFTTTATTAFEGPYDSSTTNTDSYSDSAARNTPTSSEVGVGAEAGNGGDDEDEPLLAGDRVQAQDEPVTITYTDITRMGLDPSSGLDRAFVQELVEVWWGRKANVKGDGITCCGFRIL